MKMWFIFTNLNGRFHLFASFIIKHLTSQKGGIAFSFY